MIGTYDPWLVALSIVVAVIASYVALDLAARVAASRGSKAAKYWLLGGAPRRASKEICVQLFPKGSSS